MKMNSNPSQFELAMLAMMSDGKSIPADRVEQAMAIWDEAGKTLSPESQPRAVLTLEQMLENFFPDIGNDGKKKKGGEISTIRMAKYRKFLEWCEWIKWGPDLVRYVPNEEYGGLKEIPVIKSFIQKNVRATIKIQETEGISNIEEIEKEFSQFCDIQKMRLRERGRKGAAVSHAKKAAAKSSKAAANNRKKATVPRKKV